MGKRLIIKGADFSENALEYRRDFIYDAATSSTNVWYNLPTADVGKTFDVSGVLSNYSSTPGSTTSAIILSIHKLLPTQTGDGTILATWFVGRNAVNVHQTHVFSASDIEEGYVIKFRINNTNVATGTLDGSFSVK